MICIGQKRWSVICNNISASSLNFSSQKVGLSHAWCMLQIWHQYKLLSCSSAAERDPTISWFLTISWFFCCWTRSHYKHRVLPALDAYSGISMLIVLPAPQQLLDLISCSCKKGCKSRQCSCVSNSLKCTDVCHCSCDNLGEDERMSDNNGDDDSEGSDAEYTWADWSEWNTRSIYTVTHTHAYTQLHTHLSSMLFVIPFGYQFHYRQMSESSLALPVCVSYVHCDSPIWERFLLDFNEFFLLYWIISSFTMSHD